VYFGKAPGPHFGDLGSLLGSVLETILGTFGVPFLRRFLEGFQGLPESRVGPGWKVIWSVSGVLLASTTVANQLVC